VREYNAHILFVPRTCREEFMTWSKVPLLDLWQTSWNLE
jgi:hypothetical protein